MSTESEATSNERNTSGLKPWTKGQSGNPLGRKPKELVTVERMRKRLAKDLRPILETVIKAAKEGDIQAARTILERVLPPLKAIEAPMYLGTLEGSLSQQGVIILQAMAAGSLAPAQATQLLGALAAQAKIKEVDELEQRLAAIEKRIGANGHADS